MWVSHFLLRPMLYRQIVIFFPPRFSFWYSKERETCKEKRHARGTPDMRPLTLRKRSSTILSPPSSFALPSNRMTHTLFPWYIKDDSICSLTPSAIQSSGLVVVVDDNNAKWVGGVGLGLPVFSCKMQTICINQGEKLETMGSKHIQHR